MKDNISKHGSCSDIFIGGSSAGSYLSMMLCFDKKHLGAHGIKSSDFAGFVHDAGQLLRERGADPRRVIVDETSPLYYVGLDESYPNMLFIVSDNDIECRYEQTMLTVATLKHFGHTFPNVQLKIMHGTHCAYSESMSPSLECILCEVVCGFIKG